MACMWFVFSFCPREAFRSPIIVLAFMFQMKIQRKEECICYIVCCITGLSCKNKTKFSVSIHILKLNMFHKNKLLVSQQILGSNTQCDRSLVNASSSKNLQFIIRNQHLETPCLTKINDWLSRYFMITNVVKDFSLLHMHNWRNSKYRASDMDIWWPWCDSQCVMLLDLRRRGGRERVYFCLFVF